jgi:hypothetical protein
MTTRRAIYIRSGVIAGVIFSVLQLFPTGDGEGRMVARADGTDQNERSCDPCESGAIRG